MINLIYGVKGSGKTKRIIDEANKLSKEEKGVVVYLTDNKSHSLSLDNAIRFINVDEYGLCCESCLKGFLKGLIAGNSDISVICIDGLARFLNLKVDDLQHLFTQLEAISEMYKVNFVITISVSEVPKFMKKYI